MSSKKSPRILLITPEISYVSKKLTDDAERLRAKAGGLADVSALLVHGLRVAKQDIHLAIPHYRNLFRDTSDGQNGLGKRISVGKRIHLAEDCRFYRRGGVYSTSKDDLLLSALAFQRDLINHIIPKVRPDIIHCNDWMTGLIPAAAKKMGIPTLFTIHNIHTETANLSRLEDQGIAAGDFWQELFFKNYPESFDESYWTNPIDFLATGISSASHVNVVSPSFLHEITDGVHSQFPGHLSHLLNEKLAHGAASGIVNAPDSSFNPQTDPYIPQAYGPRRHHTVKPEIKADLQRQVGLEVNPDAPLLFWPSRLDPIQKGCQLLADILYEITRDYHDIGLQILLVADGPYQEHFHKITDFHGLHRRVSVQGFSEPLSRLGYAASDFVLMPSSFEPCGLPQMIGARYGSLPIAHATGGLKDTVFQVDVENKQGNGFLFEHHDRSGLRWAIDQAMIFHQLDPAIRNAEIARIMNDTKEQFSAKRVVSSYREIYDRLAQVSSEANS